MIESIDTSAISAIPFLDLPLAVAARVFTVEGRFSEATSASDLDLSQISKGHLSEISLGVCNSLLTRLSEYVYDKSMSLYGHSDSYKTDIGEMFVRWRCIFSQGPCGRLFLQSSIARWLSHRHLVSVCSFDAVVTYLNNCAGLDNMGTSVYQGTTPLPPVHGKHDDQDLTLAYSDSELSREASPMLFDFPLLLDTTSQTRMHQARMHQEGHGVLRDASGMHLRQASSDPTPTTMLPPVSLASGAVPPYEDYVNYVTPFPEGSSPPSHDYFAMSQINGDCLPAYGTDNNQNSRVQSPFPPSPWSVYFIRLPFYALV